MLPDLASQDFSQFDLPHLVQQGDFVARSDCSFDKYRTVQAGLAVVRLSHPSQDFRPRLSRIGIESDHLAARVTVHHRYDGLGAYLEPTTDKRILGEAAHGLKGSAYVCPEAPFVQG